MSRLALRREEDARFWRALPWAVLAWVLIFFLVGHFFLRSSKTEEPPAPPVEARIVELPEVQQPPPAQQPAPQPEPQEKQPAPTPAPVKPVQDTTPPPPPTSKPAPAAPPPPPPPPPTAPAPANANFGVENHGVLATYKPDPVPPDDLLDQVSGMTITARFHVNADGTFTVDLVQKGLDPRLKRALLDVLKTWKFNPAVQAGKPVAAPQDFSFAF